jgi:hypothetical protein
MSAIVVIACCGKYPPCKLFVEPSGCRSRFARWIPPTNRAEISARLPTWLTTFKLAENQIAKVFFGGVPFVQALVTPRGVRGTNRCKRQPHIAPQAKATSAIRTLLETRSTLHGRMVSSTREASIRRFQTNESLSTSFLAAELNTQTGVGLRLGAERIYLKSPHDCMTLARSDSGSI